MVLAIGNNRGMAAAKATKQAQQANSKIGVF